MYPTWKDMPKRRKNQNKGEDQGKGSEKEAPQTNPRFFVATTLTPQPLNPP